MRSLLPALLTAAVVGGCTCQTTPKTPVDPCDVNGKNPCTLVDRNLCVNEDGTARCLCNAGFISRPSGACEAIGATNCPEHAGDGAEPDDCMLSAKLIQSTDQPRTQSVDPIGDYDFYKFNAVLKNVYVVTVKPSGALLPRIDAFDQGGLWLTADERTGQAQLAFKAAATGPHFIRVSQSPIDPSVATGNYTLTFATTGAEDHGDGPTDATAITATLSGQTASSIPGRFEFPNDQDWFSFSGTTTQNYRISFDGSKPAPVIALFVGQKFDIPKWTAQQPIVDFDLAANETVYLAVYAGKEQGSYSFQFTRTAK
jgi:hypothetical protein